MKPDAVIRIRFLTSVEGGRSSPITSERYGCPLLVNGQGFDCRFVVEPPVHLEMGNTYDIAVKFLSSDLALRQLQEGATVTMWEGKAIGVGKVLKILTQSL